MKYFIAVFLLICAGLVYVASTNLTPQTNTAPEPHTSSPSSAILLAFTTTPDAFVATGKQLERVEVWGIPTGTEVTPEQYHRLGQMELQSTTADSQTWTLPVPQEPQLLTQIFARGYGADGSPTTDLYLPETGATALYDTLWASSTPDTKSPATLTLADSGNTFQYHLTDRFSVTLPTSLTSNLPASCKPVGIIGAISNHPDVPDTMDVASFEAVAPGSCTLTWGDFTVQIVVSE